MISTLFHPKVRLVMTLLVRDEADIVEQNICYHLTHGVDHIIATDNGSVDGTTSILKKYQKLGVLTLIEEPEQTYEQSKWVSHMAQMAVSDQKATHLFHCDADEFWVPQSGDLKKHVPHGNTVNTVPLLNYLPEVHAPTRMSKKMMAVTAPFQREAARHTDPSYRYLLYSYQPKILTSKKFTQIAQGNHLVLDKKPVTSKPSDSVLIHHFPIRSYKQFKRKVINGGKSYQNNPNQSPEIGWQWKEWYKLMEFHYLPQIYEHICLPESERKILTVLGRISSQDVPVEIRKAVELFRKK